MWRNLMQITKFYDKFKEDPVKRYFKYLTKEVVLRYIVIRSNIKIAISKVYCLNNNANAL